KNAATLTVDVSGNWIDARLPFSERVLCLQGQFFFPLKGGKKARKGGRRLTSLTFKSANPGFGKTTLSSCVIEDLQSQTQTPLISPDITTSNLAFFHFDLRRPEKREESDALRAITTQLFHQNQTATDIIDAISLIMDVSGSGKPRASDDDIQ